VGGETPKISLFRYAVDMIITGSREEILLNVKEILKDFLYLELKEEIEYIVLKRELTY